MHPKRAPTSDPYVDLLTFRGTGVIINPTAAGLSVCTANRMATYRTEMAVPCTF